MATIDIHNTKTRIEHAKVNIKCEWIEEVMMAAHMPLPAPP